MALLWSILFTVVPMILTTLILGRTEKDHNMKLTESGWLLRSREELPVYADDPNKSNLLPNSLAIGLLAGCVWVVYWLW